MMINNARPARQIKARAHGPVPEMWQIIIGSGLQNQKNRAIVLVSETTKYAIK